MATLAIIYESMMAHRLRIDYCQTPIFRSHLLNIRCGKDPEKNRQYQAARSNLHWVDDELFPLFSQFHNEVVLSRLRCGARSHNDVSQQGSLLESFLELITCTAGERAWHMLHHSYTFPEQWAAMLAPLREGLDAFEEFRHIAELVISAETALKDPKHGGRVAACRCMQTMTN